MNAAGTGFQTQYANWRLEPWAEVVEVAALQQAVVLQHQQETVKSAVLALVVQVPTSRHRSGVVAAQAQAEEAPEVVKRHPTATNSGTSANDFLGRP